MTIDRSHWDANLLMTDQLDFDVDRYVKQVRPAPTYDLRQKLQEWREVGVVTFEDCIPTDLIDALLSDIQTLSDNRDQYQLEVEHRGKRYDINALPVDPLSDTGIKFNCLENISLAARRLSLSALVTDFLRHVFQDAPVVIQSLTFWRGSEQPAHLDYPWVRVQTRLPHLCASWIPLEDIAPDSGPLAYYAGSHRPGVIPPFDWGNGSLVQESDSTRTPADFVHYLADQVEGKNLQKIVFLPRRGDVLLWHGSLLHEGTKVQNPGRTRRSYVTHYTSLGAYPALHRYPDAERLQRYTFENGGYCFDHPWCEGHLRLPSWRTLAAH